MFLNIECVPKSIISGVQIIQGYVYIYLDRAIYWAQCFNWLTVTDSGPDFLFYYQKLISLTFSLLRSFWVTALLWFLFLDSAYFLETHFYFQASPFF